jgi:hypothetical protein
MAAVVARDLTSSANALSAHTPFLVSVSAIPRSMIVLALGPVFQVSSSIEPSSAANLSNEVVRQKVSTGVTTLDQSKRVSVAFGKSTGAEHSGSSWAARLTRGANGAVTP